MKADAKTEAAVLAVLRAFAAHYARGDVEGVMALHVPDPDVSVFPMGHLRMGREQVRAAVEADVAQFGSLVWEFGAPSVSAAGVVAWATMDATVSGQMDGKPLLLGPCHLTWVLEKRGDAWLIAHVHVSAVASDAASG